MNRNPFFSIIVPSFNQGKYIKNTIESVINQSFPNWELIIQDGGSTDNTKKVCEYFLKKDKRISFTSEKDKGFADAVNKAIGKANGTFASIQSSDDFFASKTVFQDVFDILQRDQNLKLVSGNFVSVNEDLKVYPKSNSTHFDGFVLPESVFSLNIHFNQSSTFFELNRAKEINLLNPNLDMVADTDFWIRYCCSKPVLFNQIYRTSKVLGAITVNPEQRSSELSKFFKGRALMGLVHLKDPLIDLHLEEKKRQGLNLLNSAYSYFLERGLPLADIESLFKEHNCDIPRQKGSSLIKNSIMKILKSEKKKKIAVGRNDLLKGHFPSYSMKWF